jgi:hypothetical protein
MWSESVIVCGPNLCRFVSFVYIYCVTIAYEILVVHKIASSTVFLTGCSFIIKVKKFVTHELLPGTNHPRAELKKRAIVAMFIGGGNRRTWRNPPQVTDKLYHIMLYTSPGAGVEPTTSESVQICIVCLYLLCDHRLRNTSST